MEGTIVLRTLRAYGPLVKVRQTGLLLATAWAGYLSAASPIGRGGQLLGLTGSLFLAIGGATVLNMVFDRDIDAQMTRTRGRPLSAGRANATAAWRLGVAAAVLGGAWALWLAPLYGGLICAGLFCEVVIYTVWLKRRTPWSILWGGLAGGAPILAGRSLALGSIDLTGVLLALAILFWIPTHNLTLTMLHMEDYRRVGVPTFPAVYGHVVTRRAVVLASLAAALAMTVAVAWAGAAQVLLGLVIVLGIGLLAWALLAWRRPAERLTRGLYKYASLYMMCAMVLLAAGRLWG